MLRRTVIGSTLLSCALLIVGGPARAEDTTELPTVERAMVRIARKLVLHLQDKGYKNVGVLKFLVTTDGKNLRDSVGTLNMRLARQLELALLARNNPRDPLGLIKNASAVAQRTPGANHLTKMGRTRLFSAQYPLHWGNKEVSADAFLTGIAGVSSDLQTLTLFLYLVDGKKNELVRLDTFKIVAKMDASKLTEAGESFVLRGAFDDGETEPAKEQKREQAARESAKQSRAKEKEHPYFAGKTPVTLRAFYDEKEVPIVYRNGKAMIPTPRVGQKVAFVLTRDRGKEKYGVVLKVNGENTVAKQKLPDLECRRWILDPGSGPVWVTGYQLNESEREDFRVASRKESAKLAIHYGEDAGTVSMTVFRERKGEAPVPDPLDNDAPRENLVKKARLPEAKADSYNQLLAELEKDANRGGGDEGGLILPGEKRKVKVKVAKFNPDPVPLMSLTIQYYVP